mgnify:CR=1 FL=1
MAVKIEVRNQQKSLLINPRRIKRLAGAILRAEGVVQADLSLVFVTDRAMRILNRDFHHQDMATDVLSFDLSEPGWSRQTRDPARQRVTAVEGEIVVSAVTARRNARVFASTPQREVLLYVIHGLLHLLGYDDHAAGPRRQMRAKERQLMLLAEDEIVPAPRLPDRRGGGPHQTQIT